MAKKSFEGPNGPEDVPTADRLLKVKPEEQSTGREGQKKLGKRIVHLQEQEDATTASVISRLREEVGSSEEKISGEAKTELQETMLAAKQEIDEKSPTGQVNPELQAELIEKSAKEEEPAKPIEKKELSEAETREKLFDELEEKIKLAAKKTISPEKMAAIQAADTFLEKLGLMLEAYGANEIKSVSYREGIFRNVREILEEIHRQDATAVVNASEERLSEENLQKLEDLEKKYEALQEKIRADLNVEDSEAASSGVKFISPGEEREETAAEEKLGPPVEKNEKIEQERTLAKLAIRFTEIFKGEKLSSEKFDEIISQDASFGSKINNLLNQIVSKEKIAAMPLRERIKIFMDISRARSEEIAAEMVAAGTDLKEKIGAISTGYNSDSLKIFEYLGLGKWVEDEPDKKGQKGGHIEYAKGVNIRINE